MTPKRKHDRHRGFSLIELMIAIAVFAIMTMAITPALQTTARNARIRAVAAAWHDGLTQARVEAIRRNAQVTFCPGVPTSSADWALILTADGTDCQTGSPIAQYNAGDKLAVAVLITLPKGGSATYDGIGRLVPMTAGFAARITPASGSCLASGGDVRCLSVEATAGYVRTCDPAAAANSTQSCNAGG